MGEIQTLSGGEYIDSEPIHQFGFRLIRQMRRRVEAKACRSFLKVEWIMTRLDWKRLEKAISIKVERRDEDSFSIRIIGLNYWNFGEAYHLRSELMELENYELSYLEKEREKKHSLLKRIQRPDSSKDDLELIVDSPEGLAKVLGKSPICKRWERLLSNLLFK